MKDNERFRQIPIEIFHAVMFARLTVSENAVIMAIEEQTFGFLKTSAAIRLDKFEELTGLTRQGVVNGISKLKQKGIITAVSPGPKRGPKSTLTYSFTDTETWKVSKRPLTNSTPIVSQQPLTNSGNSKSTPVAELVNNRSIVSQRPTPTLETAIDTLIDTSIDKKTASFEDYKKQLRERFSDLDFDLEVEKFDIYWSEGTRKLQRPKLSLLNWMLKARKIKAQEASPGAHRGSSRRRSGQLIPRDQYTKPPPDPRLDRLVEQARMKRLPHD